MNPIKTSDNLPTIFLLPGELYIAEKPSIIKTILGSCVSICLYSISSEVGAMCHCLLPYAPLKTLDQPYRYVDRALTHMVLKMNKGMASRKMKIFNNTITSKIFGGANMFQDFSPSNLTIGSQNIAAARNLLYEYHIPIEREIVGGNSGMKIFFHTGTGDVYLK